MRGFWIWVMAAAAIIAIAIALYPSVVKAGPEPPKIPHRIAGQEKCLACHGAQGMKPAPSNHSTFGEGSCLGCHTAAAAPSQENACLSCHNRTDLRMTLANGEELSLYVNPEVFAASIHGNKLLCTDCHSSISGYPHPKREIPSRREYNVAQYELCKRCHFANYTKTFDSVHFEMLSKGDPQAPLCTDCHGAHNVSLPSQPRAKISQTCSRCHDAIYKRYAGSVHGKALIEENNLDVPVCTDCHRSHNIEDPRTAAFRLESVKLCGGCHGNEKLMGKYGISTKVLNTYLQDFHGRSVALIAKQSKDVWAKEPVCTDCHGVHDIQKSDATTSPVMKANLVTTCRKCHPDATASFSNAWLSHYEPSLDRAPMVFLARGFYWFLIPFILVGLSVHILLDLWRGLTNR